MGGTSGCRRPKRSTVGNMCGARDAEAKPRIHTRNVVSRMHTRTRKAEQRCDERYSHHALPGICTHPCRALQQQPNPQKTAVNRVHASLRQRSFAKKTNTKRSPSSPHLDEVDVPPEQREVDERVVPREEDQVVLQGVEDRGEPLRLEEAVHLWTEGRTDDNCFRMCQKKKRTRKENKTLLSKTPEYQGLYMMCRHERAQGMVGPQVGGRKGEDRERQARGRGREKVPTPDTPPAAFPRP